MNATNSCQREKWRWGAGTTTFGGMAGGRGFDGTTGLTGAGAGWGGVGVTTVPDGGVATGVDIGAGVGVGAGVGADAG